MEIRVAVAALPLPSGDKNGSHENEHYLGNLPSTCASTEPMFARELARSPLIRTTLTRRVSGVADLDWPTLDTQHVSILR